VSLTLEQSVTGLAVSMAVEDHKWSPTMPLGECVDAWVKSAETRDDRPMCLEKANNVRDGPRRYFPESPQLGSRVIDCFFALIKLT
jgi:hypothetical protein